jgi:hypothetical protein
VSLAAQVMSSYRHSGHSRQGQLHCEVESHIMVLHVSVVCFVFSFISYPIVKGICIILTITAGKLESRCLSTIVFVKEIDSFSGGTCYPDCAKVFDC